MIIDQKNIIIGFIVAFVLVLTLGLVIPVVGIYLALIIAGILTGYMVNDSITAGMMHGAIIGVLSGIATIAVLFLRTGGNSSIAGVIIILALWYIGTFIIMGVVGGALGSLIKQKRKN
jgi:hypothetical protein